MIDITPCDYRQDVGGERICFCTHPEIAKDRRSVSVEWNRCAGCELLENTGKRAHNRGTCSHLLEIVNTQSIPCQSCSGSVVVDAAKYGCAVHGECVRSTREWNALRQQAAASNQTCKIKRCETCNDKDDGPKANQLVLADDPLPVHFVTTLTDDFTPGLVALLKSLNAHSGIDYTLTVICLDKISFSHRMDVVAIHDVEWIDRAELAPTPNLKTSRQRLAPNFNKLLAWHLPVEHQCIFIDSDCLCTGELTQLQYWRPLTVVRNFVRRERKRRTEAQYQNDTLPIWNSGVFCYQPDREIGEAIVEFSKRYATVALGDQEILNDYFAEVSPDSVQYAGYEYNYRTYLDLKLDVRILHFAHPEKPWRDQPQKAHQRESFRHWQRVYSSTDRIGKSSSTSVRQ